jgi:hypothetical protein
MKSPDEVAPTPAPIGIVPLPPKPPDVLGQHWSASTVLHPIMSIARIGGIVKKNERMG